MSGKHRNLISFDCYGTLIRFDLDGAVRRIVGPRAAERNIDIEPLIDDLRVIRFFATSSPYRRYQDILRDTLEIACLRHGIAYDSRFADELLAAVRQFEAFDDVRPGLSRLQEMGYQLALLTNSDDDLITDHIHTMAIEFDYVCTAEQARAYKPRRQAFEYLFQTVDRPREFLTHAAQGWEYDIIPTFGMGVRRVWINRSQLPGNQAFAPYHEVNDTHQLADLMQSTNPS